MGEFFENVLNWLKNENLQKLVAVWWPYLAAIIGALWTTYTFFHKKFEAKNPETLPAPVITNSATGGNITIYNHHGTPPEEADRKHQELLAAIAREKGINPKFLTPLFEAAGHDANINPEQFETAIRTAVEALIFRSNNPVQPSNDGADIDEAIREARQKLFSLDIEGALTILRKRDNEQAALVQARNRGRASLKIEEAEIYKSSFRHTEAITALNEATILDPEDFWALIELGDIHWHVLRQREPALVAYSKAEASAKKQGQERGGNAALNRKGDVLAVFDPAAALKAYQDSLAIRKALVEGDKANREYQRDLSVSYDRIGNMLATSDPAAALESYQNSLTIAQVLAERDPANRGYQRDLSMSYAKIANLGHNSRENWGNAHEILANLQAKGLLDPVDEWMVEDTRAKRDAAT